MRAFDLISNAIAENETPVGLSLSVPTPEPDGEEGRRTLAWRLDAIERELIDDTAYLLDTLSEDTGVGGDILLHVREPDDSWVRHQIVVGNLEGGERGCWAVYVDCCLMEDAGFNSEADIELIEDRTAILAKLQDIQAEHLANQAGDIVAAIRLAVGHDPAKLLALKQAIRQAGGEKVMEIWDAEAVGVSLENNTAPAGKRGSGGPGRL